MLSVMGLFLLLNFTFPGSQSCEMCVLAAEQQVRVHGSRELMASVLLTDGVCIDVSPPSGSAGNANAGWGSSDERAPI